MTNPVLLPIDLNQESSWKPVLPVAEKMARDDNADLHVLTVIPDYGMAVVGSFFPADYAKNTMKETEKLLQKLVSDHLPADLNVHTHVRFGTIYKEVLQVADEIQCSLIIMASHRPETQDYLLGPNAARVVRHARQSVYVVRG
ncbi:MAG: universal stress protein [Hyphomicrobiales bacterium]|nr:universal stress protein [Hyphomicrobiales bacterium]